MTTLKNATSIALSPAMTSLLVMAVKPTSVDVISSVDLSGYTLPPGITKK